MLLYSKNDKGFYNVQQISKKYYSIVIDMLEFFIDIDTNKLLSAQGFFPLDSKDVIKEYIKLPDYIEYDYEFNITNAREYISYDFTNFSSVFKNDFVSSTSLHNRINCIFDEKQKIVKWGIDNDDYLHFKINKNVIISLENDAIRCIYIVFDDIVD